MEIFVKDFSGTTGPRILKFGTNIKYDRLYCVLKNQPYMAYQSLYYTPAKRGFRGVYCFQPVRDSVIP